MKHNRQLATNEKISENQQQQ